MVMVRVEPHEVAVGVGVTGRSASLDVLEHMSFSGGARPTIQPSSATKARCLTIPSDTVGIDLHVHSSTDARLWYKPSHYRHSDPVDEKGFSLRATSSPTGIGAPSNTETHRGPHSQPSNLHSLSLFLLVRKFVCCLCRNPFAVPCARCLL